MKGIKGLKKPSIKGAARLHTSRGVKVPKAGALPKPKGLSSILKGLLK